jgi:hypothetical protein
VFKLVKKLLRIVEFGTIEDLDKTNPNLQLTQTDIDVDAVKEYFGYPEELKEFMGFFVDTTSGDYSEVYGFTSSLPYLSSELYHISLVDKSPKFPYPECLQHHTLDFCLDKDCKYLQSHDNYQNFYCELVFWKLEERYYKTK